MEEPASERQDRSDPRPRRAVCRADRRRPAHSSTPSSASPPASSARPAAPVARPDSTRAAVGHRHDRRHVLCWRSVRYGLSVLVRRAERRRLQQRPRQHQPGPAHGAALQQLPTSEHLCPLLSRRADVGPTRRLLFDCSSSAVADRSRLSPSAAVDIRARPLRAPRMSAQTARRSPQRRGLPSAARSAHPPERQEAPLALTTSRGYAHESWWAGAPGKSNRNPALGQPTAMHSTQRAARRAPAG